MSKSEILLDALKLTSSLMCGGLYFLLNYPSTCMYTQVPHVDHGQGAEKRRGLELQVAKVAKRGEVEDDPEAHEKCPPAAWIIQPQDQTRKDGTKKNFEEKDVKRTFSPSCRN